MKLSPYCFVLFANMTSQSLFKSKYKVLGCFRYNQTSFLSRYFENLLLLFNCLLEDFTAKFLLLENYFNLSVSKVYYKEDILYSLYNSFESCIKKT